MKLGQRCGAVLVFAADAEVVGGLRPRFGRLRAHLAAPHAWLAADGLDRALVELCAALLWLAGLWLALGLAAAAAARLPGSIGRAAARSAGMLLPHMLQRVVIGSAGLGVLLAPVAAAASTPQPRDVRPSSAAPSTPGLPAPAWPVDPPASVTSTSPCPASSAAVTVRRGDSLWSIARRRLGPTAGPSQIAAEWPRWYGANRGAIGADPDLIHAGLVLLAPSDRDGGTAAGPTGDGQ